MKRNFVHKLVPALLIGSAMILSAFIAGPDHQDLSVFLGIAGWLVLQGSESRRRNCSLR